MQLRQRGGTTAVSRYRYFHANPQAGWSLTNGKVISKQSVLVVSLSKVWKLLKCYFRHWWFDIKSYLDIFQCHHFCLCLGDMKRTASATADLIINKYLQKEKKQITIGHNLHFLKILGWELLWTGIWKLVLLEEENQTLYLRRQRSFRHDHLHHRMMATYLQQFENISENTAAVFYQIHDNRNKQ